MLQDIFIYIDTIEQIRDKKEHNTLKPSIFSKSNINRRRFSFWPPVNQQRLDSFWEPQTFKRPCTLEQGGGRCWFDLFW